MIASASTVYFTRNIDSKKMESNSSTCTRKTENLIFDFKNGNDDLWMKRLLFENG